MTTAAKRGLPGCPVAEKGISASMASRSSSGRRLHRPSHRAGGSMGSTDVGKYQELPRARASVSSAERGRT